MSFIHRHLVQGVEFCGLRHDTINEARTCEMLATEDGWDDVPCCSICDGAGHGYPGGGPCPLEVHEIQAWETDREEAMALAFA